MKKIYMILAAMSLLTLSLNAQVILEKNPNTGSTSQSVHRAPLRIDLPANQYLVGPYTTDDLSSDGVGIYQSGYIGYNHMFGVMLEPAEFESYLGGNIVAFRAGFSEENDITKLFVYPMVLYSDSTFTIGTGQELIINNGNLETYDAGWHTIEVPASSPMELTLPEGYNRLFIGYEYHQYSTSGYRYPIGINENGTRHMHLLNPRYHGTAQGWSRVNMPTADDVMAMQLIVEMPEKTATPTITYTINDDGTTVTINVEGNGELHMYVDGNEVPFPYTVGRGTQDYELVVTATAEEEGKLMSDEAMRTITIPKADVEMTAEPSISTSTGDINVAVTCQGDGEVHMYVDGREVPSPWYLERLEEEYTVVIRVTAQEEGKGMSTHYETVTVPARGSIDLTGWTELPGTFEANQVINWGTHIMFVDRFSVSTATDSHPSKYDYQMKEDKTVEPQSTNTVIVPVLKTGSVINGYYTKEDVETDKNHHHMELNLMNADFQMNLERNGDIYYYTMERSVNDKDDDAYIELTRPQHNIDDSYTEMGSYFTEEPMNFASGIKHRLDTVNAKYYYGEYANGNTFMTYAPIVWSFGNLENNKRVNFDVDKKHNSYGSSIWQTGVGKVVINANQSEIQRQQGGWNTWTYQDNGVTKNACTYRAQISAHGYLPQDGNSDVNVEYEPYLFRIWVHSDSLRNYSKNPTTGRLEDNGAYGDTIMWLADVPCELIDEVNGIYNQDLNYGDVGQQTSYDNQLIFGAGAMDKPEILVRFYYRTKVKDIIVPENPTDPTDEPTTLREPTREVDQYGRYYAVEDGYSDNPSTGVDEYRYVGEVVEQMYYNVQGMKSETPFSGINIVVTRYSDGTTTTTKVVR